MSSSRCDRAALVGAVALSIASCVAMAEPAWCPGSTGDHANEVPRYDHIFVIIAENHGYAQIIGNPNAPNLNLLAACYSSAAPADRRVHANNAHYNAKAVGGTLSQQLTHA